MKILVIKTSALGDIVQTFPAVRALKEHFPEAEIDWVVEKPCASLVLAHPFVQNVHVIETKKWRKSFAWQEVKHAIKKLRGTQYDLIFDFQGNLKSGIITGLARGKMKIGFGKKTVAEFPNLFFSHRRFDPEPQLNIREDYLSLVEGYLGKKGSPSLTWLKVSKEEQVALDRLIALKGERNILVSLGSKWKNKKLPLDIVAKGLKDREATFWIIQSSLEEKEEAEALKIQLKDAHVMETLSLPLLQHWMGEMELVISMDSLPLHLAAEAGVATYSFFGPSMADKYRPLGLQHGSIQGVCPYGRKFNKRCPILRRCPTGACMKNIDFK